MLDRTSDRQSPFFYFSFSFRRRARVKALGTEFDSFKRIFSISFVCFLEMCSTFAVHGESSPRILVGGDRNGSGERGLVGPRGKGE